MPPSISPIILSSLGRSFRLSCPILHQSNTRMKSTAGYQSCSMDDEKSLSLYRKVACMRICLVSGFSTELLEVESEAATLNVLVIPGNPGVVSFYKDFVEALYEQLGGCASITAIGHVSQSRQDMAYGRLFSFQEQINHKVGFIKELQNKHLPIILVGHSIGSYICIEILKRFPEQEIFSILLYPFLTLNTSSLRQRMIGMLSRSSLLSATISHIVALLGSFPTRISRAIVIKLFGPSWSTTAVDAACNCLMKYHTMRNALFMAKFEFEKLSEEPDWRFLKENNEQIAFLFGNDDHWGPLSLFEEISRQVPDALLSIEREGHTHSFSCSEAGSVWVARHVANFIKNRASNRQLSQ
ncbi:lipid droplet-associated hydrolase [Phalaenopsis equestris]|uniref:lipid droplet-associated hydrolase n=1 Tax=Phalaenopsis equestris TaxID=78828 RepID=UPI0009E3B09F|nr:lipid droplet-associated hydrolase [Phalaenopsis equestris]